jgi:hypothetical protein
MENEWKAKVDSRLDGLDRRVDDVGQRMDAGFARVDAELRGLNSRIDGLQLAMFQVGGGVIIALIGLIATQL